VNIPDAQWHAYDTLATVISNSAFDGSTTVTCRGRCSLANEISAGRKPRPDPAPMSMIEYSPAWDWPSEHTSHWLCGIFNQLTD
jgi:hypothetical protein